MPVDNPRVPGIISRRLDNFVVMSRIGKHVIVGDEALDVGGEGLGPSPFGLFLAALGH